jgi:PAS domain S-box-containing protein
MAVTDLEGQIQFINGAAREMIGLGKNPSQKKLRFSNCVPPDWQHFFRNQVLLTAWEKGQSNGEMQLSNIKNGERVDVAFTAFTIPDGSGVKKWVATVCRDITKQKRAELALIASETRLAEAQKLARVGSWELDLASNRMTWSGEMYRLHHRDKNLPIPSLTQFLRMVHPEDRSACIRAWAEIPHRSSTLLHEYRTNPKLGPIHVLRSTIQVQRNAWGIANRWLGATQDVTELRRSEVRIQMLVESNAQGVYFASIDGPITYANMLF